MWRNNNKCIRLIFAKWNNHIDTQVTIAFSSDNFENDNHTTTRSKATLSKYRFLKLNWSIEMFYFHMLSFLFVFGFLFTSTI